MGWQEPRTNDWPERFNACLEEIRLEPFKPGVADCYQVPNRCHLAMTGKPIFKGVRYQSMTGAAAQLRKHGKALAGKPFLTVQDAFDWRFDQVPVAMARRGDFGVFELPDGQIASVVCAGTAGYRFLGMNDVMGLVAVQDRYITQAYRV